MDTLATGFGGIFVLCVLLPDAYLVAQSGDLGRLDVSPKRVCSSDRICVSPLPCKVSVSTIPLWGFIQRAPNRGGEQVFSKDRHFRVSQHALAGYALGRLMSAGGDAGIQSNTHRCAPVGKSNLPRAD